MADPSHLVDPMLVHQALAAAIQTAGVEVVFGLIGDGNLFLVDDLVRNREVQYISTVHESSAVQAALGYAQVTGNLGVATVTQGPGLLNTVTALTEAARSRTPVLLIAGDTPCSERSHMQDIGQREIVAATGAGFEPVRTPDSATDDLHTAIDRAWTERRPIVLDVPIDLQWQTAGIPTGVEPRARSTEGPEWRILPPTDAVDRAAGILATVRRPVILVGRGAISDRCRSEILRLASRLGAPVATTLRAKDLFRTEPANLGVFGTLSTEAAADVIAESDCIVAFGATLNDYTTAAGTLLRGKAVIHCDTDASALRGASKSVDVGILGDAAETATTLIAHLEAADVASTFYADRSAPHADAEPQVPDLSTPETIDYLVALSELETSLPADRVLVIDAGRFALDALRYLSVPHPTRLCYTFNFGSIGLGLGAGIGAAAAAIGPAVVLTGDGGFMLGGLTEFHTAVRHRLDLTVVVLNDGAYGAEHIQFRTRNLPPELSLFEWPDFAGVASSLGGRGVTVRGRHDFAEVRAALATSGPPLLIDVKLDPDRMPHGGRVAGH